MVVTRIDNQTAAETLLLKMAVSTFFTKDSQSDFNNLIKRMTDGGE